MKPQQIQRANGESMELGNKIKQLRQKSGLTQDQLASKLGVTAQAVSKWENSVTMPDITLLPQIAIEFGVTIDDLFNLTLEQKLERIENSLEFEECLSTENSWSTRHFSWKNSRKTKSATVSSVFWRIYLTTVCSPTPER